MAKISMLACCAMLCQLVSKPLCFHKKSKHLYHSQRAATEVLSVVINNWTLEINDFSLCLFLSPFLPLQEFSITPPSSFPSPEKVVTAYLKTKHLHPINQVTKGKLNGIEMTIPISALQPQLSFFLLHTDKARGFQMAEIKLLFNVSANKQQNLIFIAFSSR